MGKRKTKEEKVTPEKNAETARDWRVGEFIRQLSVVVLGIIVTFWGSDIINEYSKKKQLRSVMGLIKEELKFNKGNVIEIEQQWAKDCRMATLLGENNFHCQEMPEDTLGYYIQLFTQSFSFVASKNAMTVLLNSGLMQNIPEKQFLLSLSQTYDALDNAEKNVLAFYDFKKEMVFPVFSDANDEMRKKLFSLESNNEKYQIFLSYDKVKNFVLSAPGYIGYEVFSRTLRKLDETIQAIEEKYE